MKCTPYNADTVAKTLLASHQTRRPIKPQPLIRPEGMATVDVGEVLSVNGRTWATFSNKNASIHDHCQMLYNCDCPHQVGDIVYVAEPWVKGCRAGAHHAGSELLDPCYMWESLARTYQRIDRIRVERLHSISEADALKEGLVPEDQLSRETQVRFALSRFPRLWDSIYADTEYKFDSNPWVWVYDMVKVDKP